MSVICLTDKKAPFTSAHCEQNGESFVTVSSYKGYSRIGGFSLNSTLPFRCFPIVCVPERYKNGRRVTGALSCFRSTLIVGSFVYKDNRHLETLTR